MKGNYSNNYNQTLYACFTGFVVQAIVNNFIPLLFLTFEDIYGISLGKITLLVTINFCLQLLVDFLAIGFIDRIGYRTSAVIAHIFGAVGLVSLTILPEVFTDPFYGILLSVMLYAIGGGLLEVLMSPIVESCPTNNKEKAMSLLHSFYCWGHVGVVLISTIFFAVIGIENWKVLAIIWAIIPFLNGLNFTKVPIYEPSEGHKISFQGLFQNKLFLLFLLLMVCAGASEQAVSQWASTLAEKSLGVDKAVGDLAGPMSFAIFMGISRLLYGKYGDKLPLRKAMIGSSILCIGAYVLIAGTQSPILGLIGCAVSGFSVGIMWPGTFSLAASSVKHGGTAMFALMALAGDLGCASGPTLVGMVSEVLDGNLKYGILASIVFPMVLFIGIYFGKVGKEKRA